MDATATTRRRLLQAAMGLPLWPAVGWASARDTAATPFPLSSVRLTDGPFAAAQAVNRRMLLAHDVDRLLAGFRSEAGLAPRAEKYPNWESMGLDGHTAGHYLSALSQGAASGDTVLGGRLDQMLQGLSECQRAHGNGYLGAVPDGRQLWKDIAAGRIDSPGWNLNGRWVPLYNLHKTFAGLRDAWQLAGRVQARDLLVEFADWAGWLIAALDDTQVQTILATEHGGINEVLADVAAITGESRYLALARRYSHRALLDPLLRGEDRLDGLHANTQIPKVIGFARIGELDGDEAWIDAARFFWTRVVEHRNVAFGGNSVREHFNPAGNFSSMLESREGPETCNTYNLLRLTALLHRLDAQTRYADYTETALLNHILSSQHPGHGGYVYFTPIRPRHYRVYSRAESCFWCCVGTGMENHGKHAGFIYAHDGDGLIVDQFIASHLDWPARGIAVTQQTAFPDSETTLLQFAMREPQTLAVRIRHPAWLTGPLRVNVNGVAWPVQSDPGHYARIERQWQDGDRLDVALPMSTRAQRLPDGSPWVALMHGPLMLAAAGGDDALPGLIADDGRGSHIAPGAYLPLDGAPMLVGTDAEVTAGLRPMSGPGLQFVLDRRVVRPTPADGLRLQPLFRTHDTRYMAYWRIATPQDWPEVQRDIQARERALQRLDALTVDRVMPGEQQPEVEHGFQGEDTATGLHLGRHWRDAGGWFSYRLAGPDDDTARALLLGFYGAERHEGFVLELDGEPLTTIVLAGDQPERFIDYRVALPPRPKAGAGGGTLTLRFVAGASRTARLFDLRLLRGDEALEPTRS